MGAMNRKLDLIIASMQKPSLPESEGDEIVEECTKNVAEVWDEVKPRGRAKKKPTKPCRKPRSTSSSSSSSSSSSTEQKESETKYFERKRFVRRIISSNDQLRLSTFV